MRLRARRFENQKFPHGSFSTAADIIAETSTGLRLIRMRRSRIRVSSVSFEPGIHRPLSAPLRLPPCGCSTMGSVSPRASSSGSKVFPKAVAVVSQLTHRIERGHLCQPGRHVFKTNHLAGRRVEVTLLDPLLVGRLVAQAALADSSLRRPGLDPGIKGRPLLDVGPGLHHVRQRGQVLRRREVEAEVDILPAVLAADRNPPAPARASREPSTPAPASVHRQKCRRKILLSLPGSCFAWRTTPARYSSVMVTFNSGLRMQEVYYRVGEMVQAGPADRVAAAAGNVKVRFFVPQAMLPGIHIADRVTVTATVAKSRPGRARQLHLGAGRVHAAHHL